MKYAFLFFLIFLSFISYGKTAFKDNMPASDSMNRLIKDSIMAINFSAYIGKPIDSLIAVLPKRYEKKYVTSGGIPIRGEYLIIEYTKSLGITIRKSTRNFMPVIDDNRKWNIDLFQKETFRCAIAHEFDECINGCECTDVIR